MVSTRTPVLFPNHYTWLVFVGMLDVMLTTVIIGQLGGTEANPIAHWFLVRFDVWGLLMLKCASLIVVILACEAIGKRKPEVGVRVAEWGIAVSSVPVIIALLLAASV